MLRSCPPRLLRSDSTRIPRSFLDRQLIAGFVVLAAAGCGRQDEVRHYQVPKPELVYAANHVSPDELAAGATPTGDPTDRLLGAIIPHGPQTWYFKMTGPLQAVAPQKDAFRRLVESVHFAEPTGPPAWDLPEGWQSEAGSGQRMATLSVTAGGQKLSVSVIPMPSDNSSQGLLDNVNRWRRQMALPPITADQLAAETTTIKTADGRGTLVELVGHFQSGGMGRAGQVSTPAPGGRGSRDMKYTKPEAWTLAAPDSFSRLAFQAGGGGQEARITVSSLGGGGGGLMANVNRWRVQVGEPPWSEAEFRQKAESLELNGIAGSYMEIIGASQAIYGWIGAESNVTWFIKIKGDAQQVAQQRAAFRTFLNSLEFPLQ